MRSVLFIASLACRSSTPFVSACGRRFYQDYLYILSGEVLVASPSLAVAGLIVSKDPQLTNALSFIFVNPDSSALCPSSSTYCMSARDCDLCCLCITPIRYHTINVYTYLKAIGFRVLESLHVS